MQDQGTECLEKYDRVHRSVGVKPRVTVKPVQDLLGVGQPAQHIL